MSCFLRISFSAPLNNPSKRICAFLFCSFLFYGELFAQQKEVVDFLRVEATLTPDASRKAIWGNIKYRFKIIEKTDSIYLDAKQMRILEEPEENFKLRADSEKIWIIGGFEPNEEYSVSFTYEVIPKQTLYFFGNEIWTQGQGKYTSHWLPSIDDTNEKIEFDLTIVAPKEKTIIANGNLLKIEKGPSQNQWHFDMEKPMSSYLVAFAMGNFNKKTLTAGSGIPLELYFKYEDSLKVEPTYRYSKRIFDFLEAEIGFPFPWQNYKQVPLRDFLYAGMENTTATFFSEAFMVDSVGFNDRNYINVNAHELAHQWFGNTVTAKTDADHWLQEGFATFYALLAEREIFGPEYYYWQLYQTAEQLKALSDEGKGESLLNPKASSLTFYQKGAWALYILREQIGEENFKKSIQNYLKKHQYSVVATKDFLDEVKAVSKMDISQFEEDWLHQSAFQSEQAYQYLMKSAYIRNYFQVSALRTLPLREKKDQLRTALTFPNDFIGQEAVFQLEGEPISEALPLYRLALKSNNLYVRQAVALSLQNIPREFQNEYESLLNDSSYVTKETALYQLWFHFPEKRNEYLDHTKGIMGFQNKNIRQLWLALAIITEDYQMPNKVRYLQELKQYSSEDYSFEIREKSFEYINQLQLWDKETLINLLEACVHPNWRFAKFSKDLLKELMGEPKYDHHLLEIKGQLSQRAKSYINTLYNQ